MPSNTRSQALERAQQAQEVAKSGNTAPRSIMEFLKDDRVRAQMEGAVVMGISAATLGEITFKEGRVQQDNFHAFQVSRIDAAPRQTHVHIVGGDYEQPLGGVGEPGVPPVLPALCNAIFQATGKRIRSLPIAGQLSA